MISEAKVLGIGGRVAKAILAKNILFDIKQLTDKLKDDIKAISWEQLEMELIEENDNQAFFEVTLPNELIQDFNIIKTKIDSLDKVFIQVGYSILWGEEDVECDSLNVSIQINKTMRNRIDISGDGLSLGFRGIGLGKKIYKKVISKVGYISSEEYKSYKYSHLLWSSLIKDEELLLFMNKDWVYAFLSKETPEMIISKIEDFFNYNSKEECAFDEEFVVKNSELLLNSKIAHLFIE